MSPAATSASSPSSRWCPTREQVMILEEMYRGGIKTPNASQIQHITSHLSLYGRIEGKNVFYWFQNHKARDRQKLRRKLLMHQHNLYLQNQLMYHQKLYDHNQQNNHQSPLLHHLDSPLHQLYQVIFDHVPVCVDNIELGIAAYSNHLILFTGRVEDASTQLFSYTWKADLPESSYNMADLTNRFRDRDAMMKKAMDADPTSPCPDRTLKTLELFPITTTISFKDQCTSSTKVRNPS
ncbi:hypothetical protein RJ639_020056 [Escallonia herrerae]|uniref:Homeobox domain-containing protein n=1 Tax=Escallonia herrerae TaxID=1293975 RepID=A0AA88V9L6_9ASTE|nr:hypothetical protein RJ639_020056 [Escallonia herrerae]